MISHFNDLPDDNLIGYFMRLSLHSGRSFRLSVAVKEEINVMLDKQLAELGSQGIFQSDSVEVRTSGEVDGDTGAGV